jgi:hypothetical protein
VRFVKAPVAGDGRRAAARRHRPVARLLPFRGRLEDRRADCVRQRQLAVAEAACVAYQDSAR